MPKKICVLSLIFLILSCQKTYKENHKQERYFLISHAGAGDPFWNMEFNGAKKAAIDMNIKLQIVAPETPNDIVRQVELLNAAIATKPKGIALSIPDNNAFKESLALAKKLNIPIIAFNAEPDQNSKSENPYLAFVGMDDYLAGQKLAQKLYETNKLRNTILVAMHQAGHFGLERRFLGIKNVLEEKNIKVIKLDISSDSAQSQQLIKGYLNKNNQVSAIVFVGAQGTHALARVLHKEFPQILLSSFDLTPLTLELIQEKALLYSIDQQPFLQGYLAVAELFLTANYHIEPSDINTGMALIDQTKAPELAKFIKNGVQ